jgi:wyosine [tRNA(Phe)-imidazoG37] synthetase (radical SAM superfamily)
MVKSMTVRRYKYIYGPVHSWRLGVSLGIDPLSAKSKACNFDCIYCQLGRTRRLCHERKAFVPTQALVEEVHQYDGPALDHLTFSGRGEPTLAKNLGEMIHALRRARSEKIAVITNSSLLHRADVRQELSLAHFVLAKLDACCEENFHCVDQAIDGIDFRTILDGLISFREMFRGKLALQIMFIEQNKTFADRIARLARLIAADEIQLNTPTRPSGAPALSEREMQEIKIHFKGLPALCVYDAPALTVPPLHEQDTARRHGGFSAKHISR